MMATTVKVATAAPVARVKVAIVDGGAVQDKLRLYASRSQQ